MAFDYRYGALDGGADRSSVRADAAQRPPQGMVHDDRAAVGERPHGMRRVRRHDGHRPRTGSPGLTVDGDGELALDDVPDLLVRMLVLVDRCAGRYGVVAEGHA